MSNLVRLLHLAGFCLIHRVNCQKVKTFQTTCRGVETCPSWFERLTGLPDPRQICVRYVVGKMPLGQYPHLILLYYSIRIITPVPRTHISFIFQRHPLSLAIGSVFDPKIPDSIFCTDLYFFNYSLPLWI